MWKIVYISGLVLMLVIATTANVIVIYRQSKPRHELYAVIASRDSLLVVNAELRLALAERVDVPTAIQQILAFEAGQATSLAGIRQRMQYLTRADSSTGYRSNTVTWPPRSE